MRRALASYLLAIFTIPLVLPSVRVNAESKLPACCRRDGKHHCATMDMAVETAPSGSAVKANPPKCPLFPKATTAPGPSPTMLLAALPVLHFARHSFAAKVLTSNDVYSVFLGSSVLKRGPPSNIC